MCMGVRMIFCSCGQIKGLGTKVPSGVQEWILGDLGAKLPEADDRLWK